MGKCWELEASFLDSLQKQVLTTINYLQRERDRGGSSLWDRHAFVAFCRPNRKKEETKNQTHFVLPFSVHVGYSQGNTYMIQWVGYKSWSKLHTTRNTDKQTKREKEIDRSFLEKWNYFFHVSFFLQRIRSKKSTAVEISISGHAFPVTRTAFTQKNLPTRKHKKARGNK